MRSQETEGLWLTNNGWQAFRCSHNDVILGIQPCASATQATKFIPAPIDLHVHGGGGADVMQGDEALVQVLRTHARHGTGALLATSVTAPCEQITEFLQSVKRVMQHSPADAAHLLGAHLEGPFINPDKLGAQPAFAKAVDLTALQSWFETGVVKALTYAPEMDPEDIVPGMCAHYSVKAQIGHSLCDWHQASGVIQAGVGVTHLFNAMSDVSHRAGGVATAALAYSEFAEVITDGIHVDQAAFDLARRCIPKLYSVTDATAAAGMPDGEYQLGSLVVSKVGNQVRLPDGTLAGSCLTQQQSVQVMRHWGLGWQSIANICSCFPAQWLRDSRYGEVAEGSVANWLELQDDRPAALWLSGQRHELDAL